MLFIATWGTNFMEFIDRREYRQYYAIISSIRPTVLIAPWLIQLFVSLFGKPRKSGALLGGEKLDDSSLSKITVSEALREEIVEYLLKGIRKSVSMYIGLGSAKDVGDDEEISCTSRLARFFCGCCCKSEPEDLGEINTKSVAGGSSLIGQGAINRKVKLTNRGAIHREAKRELEMVMPTGEGQAKSEFVLADEASEEANGIRFVSLGPKIFENLRELHNIDSKEIVTLFSEENLQKKKLKVKLQSGKGGAFFVIPTKGSFLIKSINEEEYDVMSTILADYYIHYLTHPTSFITPFYGCYALYLSSTSDIKPLYFILMRNVLDIDLDSLPAGTETYCFDIKGSSAGRKALPQPKVILEAGTDPAIQKETLKDDDFFESYGQVKIPPIQSTKILKQLQSDALFFDRYRLIDYSLLLFVISVPYKNVGVRKEQSPSFRQQQLARAASDPRQLQLQQPFAATHDEPQAESAEGPFRVSRESRGRHTARVMLEERDGHRTSARYRLAGPAELVNSILVAKEGEEKKRVVVELQDEQHKDFPQQTVINLIPTSVKYDPREETKQSLKGASTAEVQNEAKEEDKAAADEAFRTGDLIVTEEDEEQEQEQQESSSLAKSGGSDSAEQAYVYSKRDTCFIVA